MTPDPHAPGLPVTVHDPMSTHGSGIAAAAARGRRGTWARNARRAAPRRA